MKTLPHFPEQPAGSPGSVSTPPPERSVRALAGNRRGWGIALAALVASWVSGDVARTPQAPAAHARLPLNNAASTRPRQPRYADFAAQPASADARFIANWVSDSGDNRQLSFVIIDKKNTRVFVFDATAKLLGDAPVLLGAASGDESVPGIGQRPLSQVRPEERTTPAGRFMGEPGRNMSGEDVVWVDYDAAVSMHRVRTANASERRLERLASPATDDNRISFGCINLPAAFYDNVLSPQFRARHGVVYVLPEVKPVREVFANAYDPSARYRASVAAAQSRRAG